MDTRRQIQTGIETSAAVPVDEGNENLSGLAAYGSSVVSIQKIEPDTTENPELSNLYRHPEKVNLSEALMLAGKVIQELPPDLFDKEAKSILYNTFARLAIFDFSSIYKPQNSGELACLHSLRLAFTINQFSLRLRLSPNENALLVAAALVHDSGKSNLRPEVLYKPGRLDERERAHIQQHPAFSLAILEELLNQSNSSDDPTRLQIVIGIVGDHHKFGKNPYGPDALRFTNRKDRALAIYLAYVLAGFDSADACIERNDWDPSSERAKTAGGWDGPSILKRMFGNVFQLPPSDLYTDAAFLLLTAGTIPSVPYKYNPVRILETIAEVHPTY